jgi:hypothetical protein
LTTMDSRAALKSTWVRTPAPWPAVSRIICYPFSARICVPRQAAGARMNGVEMNRVGSCIRGLCIRAALVVVVGIVSSPHTGIAQTWTADNGNGTYSKPLFYDEFADPDIIRIGPDLCLLGSSMHAMPSVAGSSPIRVSPHSDNASVRYIAIRLRVALELSLPQHSREHERHAQPSYREHRLQHGPGR